MQIINSMLKEFNEEDIIVVSKTLPAIAPLCGLELAKIDDVVLAEFIRLGKTKYSNDDFALLIEKPKSLCEYIINHTKKIEENFDGFFSEELPQDCYAAIIGYTGIDILIKKKLIETDCNFIEINGYEQIYADYILSGHAVPTEILWQFSHTNIETHKKYTMLDICNYGGKSCDLTELKNYLISMSDTFKNLFGDKKETVIEITEDNKKLLYILSAKNLISNYKKVRNKEEYVVKAA